MDDLSIDRGWGVTIALTSGYAHDPFEVTSTDGTHHATVVSGQAFVDVGVAATYDRYRLYLNLPMPMFLTGESGLVDGYQFIAPSVNLGNRPDLIADARIGADVRLLGQSNSLLRLGIGAQLIVPSGDRADYITDGTTRVMVRLLAAGDHGAFSYAGDVGVHIRPRDGAQVPGGPVGNELLFGVAAGHRFTLTSQWRVVVGPEVYGETALDGSTMHTGVEGLMTTRFEEVGVTRGVRLKIGAGGGFDPHFGAPAWRLVAGAELFGRSREPRPVGTKE
jgi:hypothetical protein